MSTKEEIRHLTSRAYYLNAIETDSRFVDTFWNIKEELFNILRVWSYTHTMPYPKAMQEDLNDLNEQLDMAWHKIVEARLN